MIVPEENRPGTGTTDEVPENRRETAPRTRGATGRTVREVPEEARAGPDGLKER
ncbi:hypothetical protein ACH4UM_37070 [Streptomyces sp. NPDC020801]|uniref:hypothetical protein n=1 Tax=unclassified Streptomyces TaxID=2593676 RepID=UPI00379344C2